MPNSMETPLVRSNPQTTFTRRQVYMMLKEFVYPPCKIKEPTKIRMFHTLVTDLGFTGDGREVLAGKTNGTFRLTGSARITGAEMMNLADVRAHNAVVAAKLKKQGRLSI